MDLKRLLNLNEQKRSLQDSARAIDSFILLDSESVKILGANGISMEDIFKLVDITSIPDKSRYMFFEDGGELPINIESVDAILKVLSISKNDLSYIISKNNQFLKILNLEAENYFTNLKIKMENSLTYRNKNRIVKYNNKDMDLSELDDESFEKLEKANTLLYQILSMVNDNIAIKINPYTDITISEVFGNSNAHSVDINNDRGIVFGKLSSVVVFNNNLLNALVAGNSDIAIKLYEDLLVGYKQKTAVYYSQLFKKYIVS